MLVFLLFLPPILFGAGYFTSIRDFKANLRPILLLVRRARPVHDDVGAVRRVLGPGARPGPLAFALGAIVSPPDAVAATSVFNRLGAPRRMVTILEGESLVNDATALVALRTALAAATGFSRSTRRRELRVRRARRHPRRTGHRDAAGGSSRRVDDQRSSRIILTLLIPLVIYAPGRGSGPGLGGARRVAAGLIAVVARRTR